MTHPVTPPATIWEALLTVLKDGAPEALIFVALAAFIVAVVQWAGLPFYRTWLKARILEQRQEARSRKDELVETRAIEQLKVKQHELVATSIKSLEQMAEDFRAAILVAKPD